MIKKISSLVLLLSVGAAHAVVSESALSRATDKVRKIVSTCNDTSISVREAQACSGRGLKLADDLLNRTYIDWQRSPSDDLMNSKVRVGLLKSAQLAWIKYRDAHCNHVTEVKSGGEAEGLVRTDCLYEETMRRLIAMNAAARDDQ